MAGRVELQVLPASESGAVAPIWRELEERLGSDGLACSWRWTETWLGRFADLVPHRFVVGQADGRPCAIALVTSGVGHRRGPVGVRTLHIGTAGAPPPGSIYVEYNRLLCDRACRSGFADALVRLARSERGWDEFVLDGFAAADAEAFIAAWPRFEPVRQPSPFADLPRMALKDGEVVGGLTRNTRAQVRRTLREIEDGLETEWAETPEAGLDIFDELVALHQRRWEAEGLPGAFADHRVVGFHRDLIARLVPGGAVLFRARSEGRTIGCLLSHVEGERVLFYQSGLAPAEHPRLKPGLALHVLCMQECLERGLREYDFLAGESQYKRQLSSGERTLVWAVARRRRVGRLTLVDAVAAVRRRASGSSEE